MSHDDLSVIVRGYRETSEEAHDSLYVCIRGKDRWTVGAQEKRAKAQHLLLERTIPNEYLRLRCTLILIMPERRISQAR